MNFSDKVQQVIKELLPSSRIEAIEFNNILWFQVPLNGKLLNIEFLSDEKIGMSIVSPFELDFGKHDKVCTIVDLRESLQQLIELSHEK